MRRRQFSQARSEATYQALMRAAREVFAEMGFDDAQTPDIAAAAGVSVGTFYRYFKDKRQAFVEMIRHHLAEAHADVMSKLTAERFAVGGGDRRAGIDTVLDVVFAHAGRSPALERVYLAMSLRDPEVAKLRAEYEVMGIDDISRLIELLIPKGVVPDARAAAFVIQTAVLETAIAHAVHGRPSTPLSEAAIRETLREMLYRYLFVEEAPPPRRKK
jgi:AcrR family transcriptional regulator